MIVEDNADAEWETADAPMNEVQDEDAGSTTQPDATLGVIGVVGVWT